MSARPPDWTSGVGRIVVTRCDSCGTPWYLPCERCPQCGSGRHCVAEAAGTGLCVAVTRVHVTAGAADGTAGGAGGAGGVVDLALAELDEGVLVLGHAGDRLRPGDRVRVDFAAAATLAPTFWRTA